MRKLLLSTAIAISTAISAQATERGPWLFCAVADPGAQGDEVGKLDVVLMLPPAMATAKTADMVFGSNGTYKNLSMNFQIKFRDRDHGDLYFAKNTPTGFEFVAHMTAPDMRLDLIITAPSGHASQFAGVCHEM